MSLMEIRDLRHVYGAGTPFEKVALDGLSMDIEEGLTTGLIGHTGSGKSTFIQHLNALLKPAGGTVMLRGEDIFASKAAIRRTRFRVGLVFQYPEYQLFDETVFADISFGPKNQKLSAEEVDRRVREAAAFVGLSEELFEKSPLDLSGGQKRRVAIAGVLAMEPELLILDEPGAGLDPAGREELFDKLLHWRRVRNATILLVTHDMDTAALCDRLCVMSGGRIVMAGTPAEVFAHPDELRGLGLDLPECAHIAELLRQKGLPISDSVYTTEALAASLLSIWKGGDGGC